MHELTDGFRAEGVTGERVTFYNTERPHSVHSGGMRSGGIRNRAACGYVVKATALTTYPQAQQYQQDVINSDNRIHFNGAAKLSNNVGPPQTMDFRQLRYFEAIFEHGTLTSAADKMCVAPSALSHHLSNLETELGVDLFRRKPRGMEPTAAGQRLHDHAKTILKAVETAQADLREAGGEIAGNVSVGMAHSAVKAIGVELARRMMEDFPAVNFALSESLSGATLLHLMRSEVDLALVYNPPLDPQLRATPVLEERMVLIGNRKIIGKSKEPISFNELLDLPIILLRQGLSARAIMDDINLLKKIESRAKLQMNSVQAIAGSLEVGLGCVIGTTLLMREQIADGTLHFRPIIEPELSRTLYLCELTNRPATYALEAVRDVILDLVAAAVNGGQWKATLVE